MIPENVCCAELPLKTVVPLLFIVPLLVSIPAMFNVPAIVVVSVAPGFIVRLLQTALLLIEGIFVAPDVIITFVVATGTTPLHQFAAFDQSVLVFPVHCPVLTVDMTFVYAVELQPAALTCSVYTPALVAE